MMELLFVLEIHHFHPQKRNYHTDDTPADNPMIGLAVVILLDVSISVILV
jgi:hypothetical protein